MSDEDKLFTSLEETDSLEPLIEHEEDYIHGSPVLSWVGPSDLPEDANRRWVLFMIFAVILFIFISLLAKQLFLALIIAGIGWLTYMAARIPAQDIQHIVTTTGIFSHNTFYPWSSLNSFWIIKDHGCYVLGLDLNRKIFSNVMLLLGNQNPVQVKEVLSMYIPFREDKKRDNVSIIIEKFSQRLDDLIMGGKQQFSRMQEKRRQQQAKQQVSQPKSTSTKKAATRKAPKKTNKDT